MISIKNDIGKKVCHVDPQTRTVEIVHKGCKTTVTFLPNGQVVVKNSKSS